MERVEWTGSYVNSARFVFFAVCSLVSLPFLSVIPAFAQPQPGVVTRPVAGCMVFTPESSLRAAQGDLLILLGDERHPLNPFTWQVSDGGAVRFSVADQGCRFEFSVSQQQVEYASQTVAAGVVDCTAVNLARREVDAVAWAAWRHSPGETALLNTQGIQLASIEVEAENAVDPWNPSETWWFDGGAFLRGNQRVYWLEKADGWTADTFARFSRAPFAPLAMAQPLGYTRLTAKLAPNQSRHFRLVAPYLPVE